MCPKAKSDRHITHRIELQQTERDVFELLAGTLAARNVATGAGSIISPFLQMTPTSGILFGVIAAGLSLSAGNNIRGAAQDEDASWRPYWDKIVTNPTLLAITGEFNRQMDKLTGSEIS